MSLPIKLGFGGLVLSAFLVPGAWLVASSEPSSTTLADTYSLTESEYKNKFGEDFGHHFVDTKSEKNKDWWNWSFKYRWQADSDDEKDEEFKQISDGTKLSSKCEEAYKQDTKSKVHTKTKSKYEKSIWKYCSLEGKKPYTLQELMEEEKEKDTSSSETQTIEKKYKGDLISTTDSRNSKFWEIQEKSFFKNGDKEGLGNKAKKNNDSIFKKLYDGNPEEAANTLVKACEKTFKQDETKEKNSLIFCSLKPRKIGAKSTPTVAKR